MTGRRSIFGKAMGMAAGLLSTSNAAAQSPGDAAQRAQIDAQHERELRSLRLVIREAGYAAHRNRILAERGAKEEDAIFFLPYAKGLELILVADRPNSANPWMQRDLDLYQVTQDEIMGLGRRQVLAILPPLPSAQQVAGGVVALPKAHYLASLMLADGWDDLDTALDGNLLVAVPSDDLLLVIDAREDDVRAALPGFVKAKFDDASRAISPLIYRRQGGLWVEAP